MQKIQWKIKILHTCAFGFIIIILTPHSAEAYLSVTIEQHWWHKADEIKGHTLNGKIQNSFEGFQFKSPNYPQSAITLSFLNLDSHNMVDLASILAVV